MKILLLQPLKHPEVRDIPDTLEAMYEVLDCDTITAVYPWEDPVALVCDDEGLFKDKLFSRYIKELEQPIKGNFFICGLGVEAFDDLPDELIEKYTERFWLPEMFHQAGNQIVVSRLDDGTTPNTKS